MSEPYVGEIRFVGFDFAPDGWALCNGQTVPIQSYQALYALIGTAYGGDGVNTFGLPNLSGRGVVSQGTTSTGATYVDSQSGGAEQVQLTQATLPLHAHSASINFTTNPSIKASVAVVEADGTVPSPVGSALAESKIGGSRPRNVNTYAATSTAGATLAGINNSPSGYPAGVVTVAAVGMLNPANISKLPPVVAGNYIIALNGLFPMRP